MAKITIDTKDSVFEKHAVYIFKALQNVQSCVVVDGAQLANEPGFPKASSVQTQISRIAARWGLNIKASTSASAAGSNSGVDGSPAAPRTPSKGARVKSASSTPKRRQHQQQQLAIQWRDDSGAARHVNACKREPPADAGNHVASGVPQHQHQYQYQQQHLMHLQTKSYPSSLRVPSVLVTKRNHDESRFSDETDEEEGDNWGGEEMRPSPSKKRFVHPAWMGDEGKEEAVVHGKGDVALEIEETGSGYFSG